MCGQKVAQYECKSCLQTGMFENDDNGITSFCSECHQKMHTNPRRRDHKYRPILVPRQLIKQTEDKQSLPEKQKMDLFAVVCIETSHYVAFVKCGTTPDSPWCFFDSMADRKGKWFNQLWYCWVPHVRVKLPGVRNNRAYSSILGRTPSEVTNRTVASDKWSEVTGRSVSPWRERFSPPELLILEVEEESLTWFQNWMKGKTVHILTWRQLRKTFKYTGK